MSGRKRKNRMRFHSILLILCMLLSVLPIGTFAGSYKPGYWGNSEYNKHAKNLENITIAEVNAQGDIAWQNIAYCFNLSKGNPQGTYDGTTQSNEYEYLGEQSDATWRALSANQGYVGDMQEILTKIAFVGYPYDSQDGNHTIRNFIIEECGVSEDYADDVFRFSTQKAIWHVTDNRDLERWLPSDGSIPKGNTNVQVSEYVGKMIYEKALAYKGDTGLETRLWKSKGGIQHLFDTRYNILEPEKGQLTLTKTLRGDITVAEAENTISFRITAPDQTITEYSLKDFSKDATGKYTLTLTDLPVGDYFVEEISQTVTGKKVTSSCTVSGGRVLAGNAAIAAVSKNSTSKVDFTNRYEAAVGNLEITKNVFGDVTDAEAEAALAFEVTMPDGTVGKYTLADFTKKADGIYALQLKNVPVGQYTIQETKKDIFGKTVSVSYYVSNSKQTMNGTGDTVTATVETDATTWVSIDNTYSKDKGNLVLTKTLAGSLAPQDNDLFVVDAAKIGVLERTLTFKVTAPDGTITNYTLADFTKEADGRYTLTMNDVAVGEYTIEETGQDVTGKTVTVTYTVNSGAIVTGNQATAAVNKGTTTAVDFTNTYVDDTGNLVLTKTLAGDVTSEEAERAVSFKVTGNGLSVDYTLADFTKGADGKYTLTIQNVLVGNYTVEETAKDINNKTVTTTYTINAGQTTAGDKATATITKDDTATVAFTNSYANDTGKLVITKTLVGDVTADEAEDALAFRVTAPDGTETDYTLADFIKDASGKYTLTIDNALVGDYTVQETKNTIDDKSVTVTYTVDRGRTQTGDTASAAITKDGIAVVDFTNTYANDTGKLIITKTLTGDVTDDQAADALEFRVTAPDGTETAYTLADFTKGIDGKYTLTIDNALVGTYTVQESKNAIDDKSVTVTYTVDGRTETSDTATATVAKDGTATVDFNNNYTNDTGKLILTKTLAGDVTEDEAAGALEFQVTAPDGAVTSYTLADFTKDASGKYTLTIDNTLVGDYTVQETKNAIDDKSVTVTYTVDGRTETGDTANATVTKDGTATIDFNNEYSNDTGKVILTKTLLGALDPLGNNFGTVEQAMVGVLERTLTFQVTAPDGAVTNYTLADFVKDQNGKYTLTIDNALVGAYTIQETGQDVTDKTVTVTYTVDRGATETGDTANATVSKDGTATVDFNNTYTNDTGKLILTKTLEGDVTPEEAEGALEFKVTAPDGTETTYTLADFTKGQDGKYTLTIDNALVGSYTVQETKKDIADKTVTVTYTVDAGQQTAGDTAATTVTKDKETTVDFNNAYTNDTGKLILTKTLEGDVTPEEAEGALEFKVTAPDGTETTYTLADFTKGQDGKYTLTIDNALVGAYTVQETKKDVADKTVSVTYTVDGRTETGDTADATVTKDKEITVDFNNAYTNDTGKLILTKTLEGDVTPEEAEGALEFKVTAPDGTETTYTLADFTKDASGKYTLTIDNALVGAYTVQETKKDIADKTVSVTYTVDGRTETGDAADATVTKDKDTTVAFNNAYSNDTGRLVLTKTLEGDVTPEEAEGALEFQVTAPDGAVTTYTLADFTKGQDGKYTLIIDSALVGTYTVQETKKDIADKTVTVTYTVDGRTETGDTADATVTKDSAATVDFTNSYTNDRGDLVITKTLEGDVTPEEAEGALEFKVTAPDGTETTYTLADFTKDASGKYTLTIQDILVGTYTVQETKKDITDKTVTVTYTVDGRTETGDTADATVTKDGTATVDFNNSYVNDKGKLILTKTLEGDVTAEEAEGALVFTVTAPDGTTTQFTLADFTKDANGKYTLELNNLLVGQYRVEETAKDITNKTVTTTYTVNAGTEETGDGTDVAVTKDGTATVDFNNAYVNDTGKIVITKTLEGDVTPEEAEGALVFTVTAPNGDATEYTLADFTKDADGKYTLEINDVLVGEYTVEETTKTIDGKTVAVSYTVNGGTKTTGDKTIVTVAKDGTETVDFENRYSDIPEPPVPNTGGDLDLPKTGDYNNMGLWTMMLFMSACAALVMAFIARRRALAN